MDLKKNKHFDSFVIIEIIIIAITCILIIGFVFGAIYQTIHTTKEEVTCNIKILSVDYEPERITYTYNPANKSMQPITDDEKYYTYFLYKGREYCDNSRLAYRNAKNKINKKIKVHAYLFYLDNKPDQKYPYNIRIEEFLE